MAGGIFRYCKNGAWVVPLNFRFTAEDVKYCCDVAEPKIIVFDEEFTDRITAINGQLPTVEEYICVGNKTPGYAQHYAKLFAGASAAALSVAIGPHDECGLYFTSGTTGQPKSILLTHDNMLWACITENVHHRQTKQDCFILIPPLYHTGAKMHWFGSFIVAGKAVILKGVSPEWTLEAVSEEGGTIVWLLVPWAQDILVKFESGELKPSDYKLDQWRLMHIGAQPVPPSLIRQWKERFPAMDYDTNYGLSESTGPGCVHLGMGNEHKIGAIGIPGFNWEFKIVDENGQTLKQGDLGELCVRGPGVMREYYRNPEATKRRLLTAGFLRAIWRVLTKTASSGSWIAKRTSSSREEKMSFLSRLKISSMPTLKSRTWPPSVWPTNVSGKLSPLLLKQKRARALQRMKL